MTVAARGGPLAPQDVGEAAAVADAGHGIGHGHLLGAREQTLELRVAQAQLAPDGPGPQSREDAGVELVGVVRLGHVVVGADEQALDALLHRVLDGQHDDDHVTRALREAHPAAHAVAVDVVQDDVEDHHVGWIGFDRLQRLDARAHRPRVVAARLERRHEALLLRFGVYAADDTKLRRRVALKVLPVAMVADDERRRRSLREARAVAGVLHPNLATVFEVGEADGTVFLAMEHVDGLTLRELLERRGGRLDPSETTRIARQIALGLAKAHEAGVVHRDLKPENVMVRADGGVKLLDFGLAKLAGGSDAAVELDMAALEHEVLASRVGRILGTPGYMSPEQAAGEAVDSRSDVFSVGVMLYEMSSGARPFSGRTTRELLDSMERDAPTVNARSHDTPAPLAQLIDWCLQRSPDARLADGAALHAELDRIPRGIRSL